MVLTEQQLQQFRDEGYLFLPELFAPEEVAVLRRRGRRRLSQEHRPESLAREDPAPRAPRSPPTPTTRPSACSAPIPA